MFAPTRSGVALAFAVTVAVALAGCASAPAPGTPAAATVGPASGHGWWYVRFRMAWPAEAEPDWSLDGLIADRVVAPVLAQHRGDIALWRFHRRAARDPAGHQFSFIFYAPARTAQAVFEAIDRASELRRLRSDGKVKAVLFDDTGEIGRPHPEDTSDRRWPLIVQKTWPYFIQGASRMWLELVHGLSPDAQEQHPDSLYAAYRSVQRAVDQIWKEEGGHALLHHLNALYAYQPLLVVERRATRF